MARVRTKIQTRPCRSDKRARLENCNPAIISRQSVKSVAEREDMSLESN